MPLPKITTAEYELKLPSSGKTIKYRPFLVREEKILILSLESEDQKTNHQCRETGSKRMCFNKRNKG